MATTTRLAVEAQVDNPETESMLKITMLAKEAFHWGGYRKPLVITAGKDGVFFATADQMNNGVSFSLDEWERLVEFVGSQVLADGGWQPDWESIDDAYKYVAKDMKSPQAWGFSALPVRVLEIWDLDGRGDCELLDEVFIPDVIPWTTLFVRPFSTSNKER